MNPCQLSRRIGAALALALSIASPRLAAEIITVGAARDCHRSTLQEAIDLTAILPGADEIRIVNDQHYTALALSIGTQDVTLVSGFRDCRTARIPTSTPSALTTLSGHGGALAPVLTVTGDGQRGLQSLLIRDGDNARRRGDGCGGGIRFDGTGRLSLRNVGIAQNVANAGGGICFHGQRGFAFLTLLEDVAITGNLAHTGAGGGIAISGDAWLAARSDRTQIGLNRAPSGNGGGIHVQTPAQADIASPGYNGVGVLTGNEARRGGALAVESDDDEELGGCVRLYTTDPTRPVRVQDNRASDVGGAFYVRSHHDFFDITGSQLSAHDFLIDGNTAPNGAVAYLTGGDPLIGQALGGLLFLNRDILPSYCHGGPTGRVACSDARACNRIEYNRSVDVNGNPTKGNVFELRDNSGLTAANVTMRGNHGTRLLSWSNSDDSSIGIENCALVDNVLTQELFRGFGEGRFDFADCTIAGNTLGSTYVLRDTAGGGDALSNLLIDQPGKLTLDHPDVALVQFSNQWIVATDTTTLKPDPTVLPGRGRFVDAERGDYRPRVGSLAVDYAPATGGVDLDARPRDVDLGAVSANERARDVGGYERQPLDPWVVNGDFVADLRLWGNPSPTHATWDAGFNAPTSVGGSLLFSVPATQVAPNERRTALSYCFNVPSSGNYRVLGQALVSPATSNRDYPIAQWRLRYASEDCSGGENASGQGFFARSGAAWQTLTAPLLVPVDVAQWTRDTTIELRLDVAQDPASVTATSLFARFDEIEIVKLPP